jgi:hypothetical protein
MPPAFTNVVRIGVCEVNPLVFPDGNWEGTFHYDPQFKRPPGNFTATLWTENGRIMGRTMEKNTFPESTKAVQTARVEGEVNETGLGFEFTKRYYFTGTTLGDNGRWDNRYTGSFDKSGRTMNGTWKNQGFSGTFEMHKQ